MNKLLIIAFGVLLVGCFRDKPKQWVNPPTAPVPGYEHITFDSQFIREKVGLSVILPLGYSTHTTKKYKVLYYLHGSGGNESTDALAVKQFIGSVLAENPSDMPILVFPNAKDWGYFAGVERMIIEEVVPLVESTYRVQVKRESRALLGFSMGGTAALRYAARYPTLFSGAGSLGGGVWNADPSLLDATDDNAQDLVRLKSEFFIVQGSEDDPGQFAPFLTKLDEYGISKKFFELNEVGHDLGKYFSQSVELYRSTFVRFALSE